MLALNFARFEHASAWDLAAVVIIGRLHHKRGVRHCFCAQLRTQLPGWPSVGERLQVSQGHLQTSSRATLSLAPLLGGRALDVARELPLHSLWHMHGLHRMSWASVVIDNVNPKSLTAQQAASACASHALSCRH